MDRGPWYSSGVTFQYDTVRIWCVEVRLLPVFAYRESSFRISSIHIMIADVQSIPFRHYSRRKVNRKKEEREQGREEDIASPRINRRTDTNPKILGSLLAV